MYLSQRIQSIAPSATLAMASKARQLKQAGQPVISLSAGEPDFDTPEHIKAAAIQAIQKGETKYTAPEGTLELRQAIAAKFRRDNQLDYAANQIVVSNGAKHSLFNLFQAVLNPGDEVIIPAPYWVSYPEMATLCGATSVIISAKPQNRLKITPEELEAALSSKTKLVVFNSPSNPSGMVYSLEEWKALGEVLKAHPQTLIVSDDIYEHMYWAKQPFSNILNACPELYDRTIVVNGASKAYAMTGWRIGYAAGPLSVIQAINNMQSQSTSNACSISQAACVAALNGDQSCLQEMRQSFQERHDRLLPLINAIPGFSCLPAEGAFYLFPNVEAAMQKCGIQNDTAFAEFLLEQTLVAAVPGSAFGAPGYLRISFATDWTSLETAMARLQQKFSS